MDDPPPKRPLADDPSFLESLSELDRGLAGDPGQKRERPSPQSRPPSASAAPVQPPSNQAPLRPSPPRAGPFGSTPLTGPRPLLDLFPPTPSFRDSTAPPQIAAVEPPRLATVRRLRSVPSPPPQEAHTYETFYGLAENPFGSTADARFLFHSAALDRVVQDVLDAIARGEGVTVVTGALGIGKTTMCGAIIEQLDRSTLTSFIVDPFITAEGLLKTVLVDFGVIARDELMSGRFAHASRADLTATLRDFVFSLAVIRASAVVIVDEAQSLAIDVLEQIRAMVDLGNGDRSLQVVLVGPAELLTVLARPQLQQLQQRVALRTKLAALEADEIPGYVMHRLAVAGTAARVEFGDAAFARLYNLSEGVPRVVNLICDRALALGFQMSASVIEAETIDTATREAGVAASRATAPWTTRLLIAAALLIMLLVGMAAAALVFRAPLLRLIQEWQSRPAPTAPAATQTPVSSRLAPVRHVVAKTAVSVERAVRTGRPAPRGDPAPDCLCGQDGVRQRPPAISDRVALSLAEFP